MSTIRYGSMTHQPEEIADPIPVVGASPSECPQCKGTTFATSGSAATGFVVVCLGCRASFRAPTPHITRVGRV